MNHIEKVLIVFVFFLGYNCFSQTIESVRIEKYFNRVNGKGKVIYELELKNNELYSRKKRKDKLLCDSVSTTDLVKLLDREIIDQIFRFNEDTIMPCADGYEINMSITFTYKIENVITKYEYIFSTPPHCVNINNQKYLEKLNSEIIKLAHTRRR